MVSEYFIFQSGEGLAVGVFIILFAVSYNLMGIFMKNRGVLVTISLVISAIAAWQLHKERYYGLESILAIVLIIVVIFIFLKIFREFFKRAKIVFTGRT